MRIVAGERRGLPLKSVKGEGTRPTSDKVKESIFNIIGPFFDGGTAVDFFGGSGALSLEALSRGVQEAYVFEKNRAACEVIRFNRAKCKYDEQLHLYQTDARNAIKILRQFNQKINYLFLDPPYAEKKFYTLAQEAVDAELLADDAVIICEHDKKVALPETYGPFTIKRATTYGNIALTIYEK